MKTQSLTEAHKRRITFYADRCVDALQCGAEAAASGNREKADMDHAHAAYWSGRAFGEVFVSAVSI